jgi:hypothetical protein
MFTILSEYRCLPFRVIGSCLPARPPLCRYVGFPFVRRSVGALSRNVTLECRSSARSSVAYLFTCWRICLLVSSLSVCWCFVKERNLGVPIACLLVLSLACRWYLRRLFTVSARPSSRLLDLAAFPTSCYSVPHLCCPPTPSLILPPPTRSRCSRRPAVTDAAPRLHRFRRLVVSLSCRHRLTVILTLTIPFTRLCSWFSPTIVPRMPLPHCRFSRSGARRPSMLYLDLTRVGLFYWLFGLKMDYCLLILDFFFS